MNKSDEILQVEKSIKYDILINRILSKAELSTDGESLFLAGYEVVDMVEMLEPNLAHMKLMELKQDNTLKTFTESR